MAARDPLLQHIIRWKGGKDLTLSSLLALHRLSLVLQLKNFEIRQQQLLFQILGLFLD